MRHLLVFFLLLTGCSLDKLAELQTDHQFSDAYVAENRGKARYETPEVYELMHVVIALTPTGRRDCLLERNTPYHRTVMTQFDTYRNHPLVAEMEKLLVSDRWNYTTLGDAAAYRFEGDRIVFGGIYRKIAVHPEAKFADYRPLAEDFARVSGFRAFFKANQSGYQTALTTYERQVPVASMWAWLETQFPDRYDSYQLNLSMLMGCFHFTNNGQDNDFAETRMFVPLPSPPVKPLTVIESTALNRMVFTEIDHNYVNPATTRQNKQLDKAMKNWRDWNTGKDDYQSKYLTFNEYMTWGVFTLYVYDTTTPEVFAQIRADKTEWVDTFMVNRGFKRFPAFNAQLLSLYKARKPAQTVADLYPDMLNWIATQ